MPSCKPHAAAPRFTSLAADDESAETSTSLRRVHRDASTRLSGVSSAQGVWTDQFQHTTPSMILVRGAASRC